MLDSCPNKHHHPAPSYLVYSEKAHSQFSVCVQGLYDGKLPSRQYALKALLLHCVSILASHDGCQGWLLFLYQAPWGPCHGHKIVKLTTLYTLALVNGVVSAAQHLSDGDHSHTGLGKISKCFNLQHEHSNTSDPLPLLPCSSYSVIRRYRPALVLETLARLLGLVLNTFSNPRPGAKRDLEKGPILSYKVEHHRIN
jgi:hypothetical protein